MKLDEQTIIRMMRTLWDAKVRALVESSGANIDMTPGDSGKSVIAPGLKIKHKNSSLLYTIDSVHDDEVVLATPEGKKFLVSAHDLENDYAVH